MTRILVVEDEQALNDITCDTLRDAGYEATGCLDANRAFDAMRGTLYDLVVSDIMMPGVDGYELATRIRAIDPNIPIIFMTARDDIMSKRRGFRAGIDDYMVKPVDLDELVLRIEALLRRAHILTCSRWCSPRSASWDSPQSASLTAPLSEGSRDTGYGSPLRGELSLEATEGSSSKRSSHLVAN
ncbi:response regulator [Bifidobacterium sp. SO4]|uniref:response regulator transcription factor n=1 Tax=Bifidobacterium sp. SO4 TaxID=2809030 RepID=UPI001BDC6521|nr:response regulator [Bifidobacterium sp. SO4]MBT1171089.1 response regulator [Bifidobacterium sp. SO4]